MNTLLYKKQKSYFEKMYRENEASWTRGKPETPDPFVTAHIDSAKKLIKKGLALDIGCGQGRHSVYLSRKGFATVGLDYLLFPIKSSRGKIQRGGYVVGDVLSAPFSEKTFDLILDYGVFHHIRRVDCASFLDNISNLLKGKGFFILSCFSPYFRHGNGKRYKRGYVVHKGHYDRFSNKKELSKMFRPHFEIIDFQEERDGKNGLYHYLLRKK